MEGEARKYWLWDRSKCSFWTYALFTAFLLAVIGQVVWYKDSGIVFLTAGAFIADSVLRGVIHRDYLRTPHENP